MWQADFEQGRELLQQGQFQEAEARLAAAASQIDLESAGPEVFGGVWHALAQARRALHRWMPALEALTRALHPLRKVYGSQDPRLAVLLFQLGQLIAFTGKPAEAEPALAESLMLVRRLGTPAQLASYLEILADFYLFHQAPERALGHLQEAVVAQVQALGQTHPAVRRTQLGMATLLERQGKDEQADELRRGMQQAGGEMAFEACLARALARKRKRAWQGEVELLKQCLELASDEQRRALVQAEMGQAYLGLGQLAEAEGMLVSTYQLQTRLLGPEHPQVALAAADLARSWQGQNRLNEAEQGYTFAHSVLHKQLGEAHPLTLGLSDRLAECSWQRKDYRRAQALAIESMKVRSRVYGDRHFLVAESLSVVGRIFLEQRQFSQAADVLAQSLSIFALYPACGDYPTLLARFGLAAALQGSYKYYEAEEHYRQVLRDLEQFYGETHFLMPKVLRNLGWLLRQTGRDRQATEAFKKADQVLT